MDSKLTEIHFRTLLEAAPDAMVIVDREGDIQYANRCCERLFGYPESALIGERLERLIPGCHPDIREPNRVESADRSMSWPMANGRRQSGLERDGTEFPVEISSMPLETPMGLSFSCAIRDVTHSVRTEQDLRDRNGALSRRVDELSQDLAGRSERLVRLERELEEFAYLVSHDLKSPIRGISSLSEWLLSDQSENLDDDGKAQLNLLGQSVGKMNAMVEGAMAYSRAAKGTVEPESIDVDKLVAEILDHLNPPAAIRIERELLPNVEFSRADLSQVFESLIENAIQHMGPAGTVVRISGKHQGPDIEFAVADDGIGISAEHHDRIFRMFQTLAPSVENTAIGIGLPIAKKIVEYNAGRISLESSPGQGATFRFTVLAPTK